MEAEAPIIRVATAAIFDDEGRILLVRKRGTSCFMQPGGKIEPDETPLAALKRELREEVGLLITDEDATYLGCFQAPAANETETIVEAELFRVDADAVPVARSEIAEVIWLLPSDVNAHVVAPLTKNIVLPLLGL